VKRIALGFLAMSFVYATGAVAYLLLGWVEVRADVQAPGPVRALMAMTVRASVRRHAPAEGPVASTAEDLVAGGRRYLDACAGCHGTPGKPGHEGPGYLPPPYLPTVRSPYSVPEIYWIIKHGIRRTGMSAYGPFYPDREIWQLATFVKRIAELPAATLDSLRTR
jgi:mono/diheme cytochrome c family protein